MEQRHTRLADSIVNMIHIQTCNYNARGPLALKPIQNIGSDMRRHFTSADTSASANANANVNANANAKIHLIPIANLEAAGSTSKLILIEAIICSSRGK